MGFLGSGELRRGKHQGAHLILGDCLMALPIVLFVIVCAVQSWKKDVIVFAGPYVLYAFFALFAAQLPIALYLNRNRNKSTSQQESANAS